MATFIEWIVPVLLFTTVLSAENIPPHHIKGKETHPKLITKIEFFIPGVPVQLNCSSERVPLRSCRWERIHFGDRKQYVLDINESINKEIVPSDGKNVSTADCGCKYNYTGEGLNKGDCSITINNPNNFHLIGTWECKMTELHLKHVWIRNTKLKRLISSPYFDKMNISTGVFYNETSPKRSDISCCVDSNDPKLRVEIGMTWENSTTQRQITGNLSTTAMQICRRNRYVFRPEDNGKRIVCKSTFMYQSKAHEEQETMKVNITYLPIFSLGNFSQNNVSSNGSLIIFVQYMANPAPEIVWHLKYDPVTGTYFDIPKEHVKYRTGMLHQGGDNYTATLEILNCTKGDYRKEFELRLSTERGIKHMPIKLISPEEATEHNPDFYWVTVMIAVSVIVFLVLLSVIVFVIIKLRIKARGKYVPTQVSYSTQGENLQIN